MQNIIFTLATKATFPRAMFLWQSWFVIEKYAGVNYIFLLYGKASLTYI